LQRQPKKVKVDGVELVAQYGNCTFMAKRQQEGSRLEISYYQKNKWDRDWMEYWFYIQTYSVNRSFEDGTKVVCHPLASVMSEMKPLSKVALSEETTPEREACDRVFALACWYSGGRDLVEEMVASNCWPLSKKQPEFTIEMVNVPVYGPVEGVPFPRFGIELKEGEDKKAFATMVEDGAREIVGKITDKEYLA
jgi:hypothetical protein